jgi:uncharacterized protein (TIGR00369 family)
MSRSLTLLKGKNMNVNTHMKISSKLVGEVVEISEGKATASLKTSPEMASDEQALVHGGFTFGLADYAAMLAVNDPFVVLGAADVKFLAPTRVGDSLTAKAQVLESQGKKRQVSCSVYSEEAGNEVFSGIFTCFVLEKHVLES